MTNLLIHRMLWFGDNVEEVVVLDDIARGRFFEFDDEQNVLSGFHGLGACKWRLEIFHIQLALVVGNGQLRVENAHFDAIGCSRKTLECCGLRGLYEYFMRSIFGQKTNPRELVAGTLGKRCAVFGRIAHGWGNTLVFCVMRGCFDDLWLRLWLRLRLHLLLAGNRHFGNLSVLSLCSGWGWGC